MSLKLSVIGCGYLGATHAACMSSLGFDVIGVDTDPHKVELLSRGELPFYEPGLDALLADEIKTGRLTFSSDFSQAKDADVHFICVGTPQSKDGLAADLTYVKSAVAAIAPHLKTGALVVGKSTVPVGTAHMLREQLAQSAPQADLARELRLIDLLVAGRTKKIFTAAHDVSQGGLSATLTEMVLRHNVGAEIQLENVGIALVSETPGRVVVAINPAQCEVLNAEAKAHGIALNKLGTTGGNSLTINGGAISIDELREANTGVLEALFA